MQTSKQKLFNGVDRPNSKDKNDTRTLFAVILEIVDEDFSHLALWWRRYFLNFLFTLCEENCLGFIIIPENEIDIR